MEYKEPIPPNMVRFDPKTMAIICLYPGREFVVPLPVGRVLIVTQRPDDIPVVTYTPHSDYVQNCQHGIEAPPLYTAWGAGPDYGRGEYWVPDVLKY